jgi:predicted metalloprotease
MTFNPNADIGGGKASKRGRNTGIAVGGGLGVIALFVLSQFLGVDLTGLVGGGGGAPANDSALEECQTGQDANERQDCRIVGVVNDVQELWNGVFQRSNERYEYVDTVFFTDQVQTGCGAATSQVGPFYCPRDRLVYIDLGFFDDLESQFGAEDTPFVEAYVIAHEYGHHVQNQLGVLERIGSDTQGAESRAVRSELQADCYAGVWAASAVDRDLIAQLTRADIASGLDAAAAIGDDRIQAKTQGQVNPESWTHGSSEQRRRWFSRGYDTGRPAECDTFTGSI